MNHTLIALSFQLILGVTLGEWLTGGLISIFFFLGREVAQTEYRVIEASPTRLRADMPVFAGITPSNWTEKSFLADFLAPTLVVLLFWWVSAHPPEALLVLVAEMKSIFNLE